MKMVSILFLSVTTLVTHATIQQVPFARTAGDEIHEYYQPAAQAIVVPEKPDQTTLEELPCGAPEWKKFFTNCSTTLITGMSTGFITGALCAYAELNEIWPLPISWLLAWTLREGIILTLCNDLKDHAIPHNKTRAQLYACISDWTTYIALMTYKR